MPDLQDRQEVLDIRLNPYKHDFPLLMSHDVAFLDSAATAQRPAAVLDAQREFYENMNANPLRGLYQLSVAATEAIDAARARVARHLGAASANEVVFTRNTSESLNLAAHGLADRLKPGDEVVISIMEHHSNLIPWQQLCERSGAQLVYLRPNQEGYISSDEIISKIGPAARIVSVAHVSNVMGVELPVREIAQRAHEMGAIMVVDGAQSVPHLPINVNDIGADLFAFSGHKVFGPMGVGVLWGRSELLNEMPPMLTGGEMIDAVYEDRAVWAPVPQKFEAGTQDAAGVFALDAALSYYEGLGHAELAKRERALVERLVRALSDMEGITLIGPENPSAHVGVVSFNVDGVHPHDVASILDADDVCIRAGHHCAQPLLAWLGVENGSCCRASVAFYNDARDIDRLIEGLEKVRSIFHG